MCDPGSRLRGNNSMALLPSQVGRFERVQFFPPRTSSFPRTQESRGSTTTSAPACAGTTAWPFWHLRSVASRVSGSLYSPAVSSGYLLADRLAITTTTCIKPETPTAAQMRYANFRLGYGLTAPVAMSIAIAAEARMATKAKCSRRRRSGPVCGVMFINNVPNLNVAVVRKIVTWQAKPEQVTGRSVRTAGS